MEPVKKEKKYPAILEIIPIFLFFALSKYFDIFVATGALVITSCINLVFGYLYTKTFHAISVITAALAIIFGSLTIILDNESFIKIKVSIINIIFALILLSGYFFKKNFLKITFQSQINLEDAGWKKLTMYWIIFFIALATLNEFIWRHFSTNAWINFKVFGIFGITFLFLLIQYPLIKKYIIHQDSDNNKKDI
jgi:intracellular septation protein